MIAVRIAEFERAFAGNPEVIAVALNEALASGAEDVAGGGAHRESKDNWGEPHVDGLLVGLRGDREGCAPLARTRTTKQACYCLMKRSGFNVRRI